MDENGTRSNGHKKDDDLTWAEADAQASSQQSSGQQPSSRQPSSRERAQQRPYSPDLDEPSRRPAKERENAFNALAWFLEGATGLVEELRHSDLGLSEDFWVHAYAARRESLLALRAVLDEMIDQSTAKVQEQAEREKRRERRGGINIDF
ncbi:MAG: hypothetical protein KDD78_01480 [Caldilineaceae bacterium]|nr:hypothetical protein [Caldilineaceae bacterium]